MLHHRSRNTLLSPGGQRRDRGTRLERVRSSTQFIPTSSSLPRALCLSFFSLFLYTRVSPFEIFLSFRMIYVYVPAASRARCDSLRVLHMLPPLHALGTRNTSRRTARERETRTAVLKEICGNVISRGKI